MQLILVLSLVFLAGFVTAYPTGAPPLACESMMPNHGVEPQNTTSPYLVSVSPSTFGPGETLYVTISSFFAGDYYEGFMVQARDENEAPVGRFEESPTEDYLLMDCPDTEIGAQNTATHNRHEHFFQTELSWTAPDPPANVTFTFTIVRGFTTFWTGIKLPAFVKEA